jgi:hypothetical protein
MNPYCDRVDLYAGVHKGLRACMAHVLLATGRIDTTDADETARTLEEVRYLIGLCASHLKNEDMFVHAAMQARRPGSAAGTLGDHEQHQQAFVDLETAVRAVENTSGATCVAMARELYALLGRFVADNYAHMHVEETQNNAVLWAEYTDAELLAIKGRLIAAMPPEKNLAFLRWMVPAMSPAERAELFVSARATMPAPAFEAALALVKNHLSGRDWFKLQLALQPLAAAA